MCDSSPAAGRCGWVLAASLERQGDFPLQISPAEKVSPSYPEVGPTISDTARAWPDRLRGEEKTIVYINLARTLKRKKRNGTYSNGYNFDSLFAEYDMWYIIYV